MTLMRMMAYVVAIGLAFRVLTSILPYAHWAKEHWDVCSARAMDCRTKAALLRATTPYPEQPIIARDVIYGHTDQGELIRIPWGSWYQIAYYETLADIWERSRWRPWAGVPAEMP